LNWEHLVEAHILDSLKKPRLETEGFELLNQLLFSRLAFEAHKDLRFC
jgi:hypothetical protein